mmetsp:Transcript_7147/g.12853  ORF Transcript_7147/g.12853 Transcript_7147/m.12853 type:complete len:267 (-) Transcript_7147:1293-2093(-)
MESGIDEYSGKDNGGKRYRTLRGMWSKHVGDNYTTATASDSIQWYAHSKDYWKSVEPSVDGMLGGLGSLTDSDLNSSREFLLNTFPTLNFHRALDVGAGIGRITFGLLIPLFDTVDMLESDPRYLKKAQETALASDLTHKLGTQFCTGMEQFQSQSCVDSNAQQLRYNLIWIQWCVIYLTDIDFVNFLKECVQCLVDDNGVICVKDNVSKSGFVVDKSDSSITRSDKHMKQIFRAAGLKVVDERVQSEFPKDLFPVKMYALKPAQQ